LFRGRALEGNASLAWTEQGEVAAVADLMGLPAQQRVAHPVKRADADIGAALAHAIEAISQLGCRVIGECDGEHALWRRSRTQKMSDAVNNNPGLPAPGPRDHQKRSPCVKHRRPLVGVEQCRITGVKGGHTAPFWSAGARQLTALPDNPEVRIAPGRSKERVQLLDCRL
jgi:hypothetical protein